jgi:hypothetical protein
MRLGKLNQLSGNVNPSENLQQLATQARQLEAQAAGALQTGYHSAQAGLLGSLLATTVIPHGLKGLSRNAGKTVARTSKANAKAQWLRAGRNLLSQSETVLRDISVNSRSLTPPGNSSKLVLKLNRVRRVTDPVTFLSTLAVVLDEVSRYDLLWNRDIPQELARRAEMAEQERSARAALRAASPEVVRLSESVDVYNRLQIADSLQDHPAVAESVLGATNTLLRQGPDANRQAIASCRASIERLAIELGGAGDWKESLRKVATSETDQRTVIGAWSYLSGKGAHGGHDPTRDEAEYGLRITIAALTYLKERRRTSESGAAPGP